MGGVFFLIETSWFYCILGIFWHFVLWKNVEEKYFFWNFSPQIQVLPKKQFTSISTLQLAHEPKTFYVLSDSREERSPTPPPGFPRPQEVVTLGLNRLTCLVGKSISVLKQHFAISIIQRIVHGIQTEGVGYPISRLYYSHCLLFCRGSWS